MNDIHRFTAARRLLAGALGVWTLLRLTRAPRLVYLAGGQHELEFLADAPNEASIAVMKAAGMSFERRLEVLGRDTVYYSIRLRP